MTDIEKQSDLADGDGEYLNTQLHTCHDGCQRLHCVQCREIDELRASLSREITARKNAEYKLKRLRDELTRTALLILLAAAFALWHFVAMDMRQLF